MIIGEGGSGGAVALAVADRVLMLEHAVYSVISPEGCAAILWRSGEQAPAAAEAMRLTAQDLRQLGVVDEIIPEPIGGAHRQPAAAIEAVGDALEAALEPLLALSTAPSFATSAARSSWRWATTAPCSEAASGLRDGHAQMVVPARIRQVGSCSIVRRPLCGSKRITWPRPLVIRNSPGRSVGATPQPSASMVEVR